MYIYAYSYSPTPFSSTSNSLSTTDLRCDAATAILGSPVSVSSKARVVAF